MPCADSRWESTGLRPQIAEVHSKVMVSVSPDSCVYVPIHWKVVNSLASLINNNLFMFWLTGFCCRNSYVSLLFLYLFRAAPQSYLRGCLLESNPQFRSAQLLSRVWLFAVPRTAACQASLSIANAQSLLELMSIELVMPSNHLILCCPLLVLPSIFPSIRVFSKESVLRIRWPKYVNLNKREFSTFVVYFFFFQSPAAQCHQVDGSRLTFPKFWFFPKFTCQSLNVTEFEFDLLVTWQASNLEPRYWGKE